MKQHEGSTAALADAIAAVDDMYALLGTYDQKPPTTDLVRPKLIDHDDHHQKVV